MMKTSNIATENLRILETGAQWEEQLSGAMGTLKLMPMQTFRVRATGATTVTIDGTLAMTMSAGEIAIFSTGKGNIINTGDNYVTVVIAGASAFVQVARETVRPRLVVNPYNDLNQPQPGGNNP
jgi:hypothetical protein